MINGDEVYKLENENFDLYVNNEVKKLSEDERKSLPTKLMLKICNRSGRFLARNKLSFFEKIFTLWKARGKRFYIVIEDEEQGMSLSDFEKYRSNELKNKVDREELGSPYEQAKLEGFFVLGTKELCDTFSYMNKTTCSPMYNYLVKAKNFPPSKISQYKQEVNYIVRFLWTYESIKKKLNTSLRLNMPELLILMYLYEGKTMVSSDIHKKVFRYCYQSSVTKIKVSFGTLQNMGMITKIGFKRNAKLSITELGKEKVNQVLNAVVNF